MRTNVYNPFAPLWVFVLVMACFEGSPWWWILLGWTVGGFRLTVTWR